MQKPSKTEIDRFFEGLWSLYPVKKGKGQVSESKRKALYEHYCDAFVLNDCSIDETILDVMKCWKEGIEL
mgnify:CR=1 FL=1